MKKRRGKLIRSVLFSVFLLCFFFMAFIIVNNNKTKVTGALGDA